MDIKTSLDLSQTEQRQLATILKVKPEGLADTLSTFASSALEEYVRMFLGEKVFTRGSDMREYRLFLLIKLAYRNRLPDEKTVSALFQCTASQSRALLRSVLSKYQYELEEAVQTALKTAIESVLQDQNGLLLFSVTSENVVTHLNALIAEIDPTEDQILRVTGKLATYELKPSTYQTLCKRLNVKPKDFPA